MKKITTIVPINEFGVLECEWRGGCGGFNGECTVGSGLDGFCGSDGFFNIEVCGTGTDFATHIVVDGGFGVEVSSFPTTENVKQLMGRLKKFVVTQPVADLPEAPQVDLSVGGLDRDADDFGKFCYWYG